MNPLEFSYIPDSSIELGEGKSAAPRGGAWASMERQTLGKGDPAPIDEPIGIKIRENSRSEKRGGKNKLGQSQKEKRNNTRQETGSSFRKILRKLDVPLKEKGGKTPRLEGCLWHPNGDR